MNFKKFSSFFISFLMVVIFVPAHPVYALPVVPENYGFIADISGPNINWGTPIYTEDWIGHSVGFDPVYYDRHRLGAGQYVYVSGGMWEGYYWASVSLDQPFTITGGDPEYVLSASLHGLLQVWTQTIGMGDPGGTASVTAYVKVLDSSGVTEIAMLDLSDSLQGEAEWEYALGYIKPVDKHKEDYRTFFSLNPGSYIFREYLKAEISSNWAMGVDSNFFPIPVPEPSTLILLGTGLAGLVVFGRKRLFKKG